jgi:cell division inhibitor SepF
MNGFIDGLKNLFLGGPQEPEHEDGYYDESEDNYIPYPSEPKQRSAQASARAKERELRPSIEGNNNLVNFRNPYTGKQTEMVLAEPTNMEGAASVGTDIRNNKACIVNLKNADPVMAQRIADFIGGLTYAVDGDIQRISDNIFIAAPASVHITNDVTKEIKKSGGSIFKWATSYV